METGRRRIFGVLPPDTWRWRRERLAQNCAGVFLCVLGVLRIQEAGVLAQAPDYSGTWKLNRSESQITAGTGIAGLGAGGAPPTLYVSQAANGTIVIGSDVNESLARTFRIAKGVLTNDAGGMSEVLSMSGDGQTLTVKVTGRPAGSAGSAGSPGNPGNPGNDVTSTLVYRKVQSDDPCEKWPTPCRYATGSRPSKF